MGRKPTGDKAMTAAERQRKRRAKLAEETVVEWKPEYLPGQNWNRDIARHNKFVDSLMDFLGYGDVNEVTEFLAEAFLARSTNEPALPPLITKRMEEMERKAVEEKEARQTAAAKWLVDNGVATAEEVEELRKTTRLEALLPDNVT